MFGPQHSGFIEISEEKVLLMKTFKSSQIRDRPFIKFGETGVTVGNVAKRQGVPGSVYIHQQIRLLWHDLSRIKQP